MAKNPLHFAVVVGINRYPAIRDLRLAKGDAEQFAAWLLDPGGGGLPAAADGDKLVTGGHVATIVVDDGAVPEGTLREDARPVRKEVFQAFHTFRKAVEAHVQTNPEDWERTRFYFYVSGHGIAPDVRDAALLLADTAQRARQQDTGPIVLAGGLTAADNPVGQQLRAELAARDQRPVLTAGSGAAGAAWLAARTLVPDPTELHERLVG